MTNFVFLRSQCWHTVAQLIRWQHKNVTLKSDLQWANISQSNKYENSKTNIIHGSETKGLCWSQTWWNSPNLDDKWLTICALMDISVGERRHKLLMAASLRITVAFLRLWQSTLRGQVAGDVCWQIHLIWNRERDILLYGIELCDTVSSTQQSAIPMDTFSGLQTAIPVQRSFK